MPRSLYVSAAVIISLSTFVHGEQLAYMDGNRLLRQCEPATRSDRNSQSREQSTDAVFCSGYVAGVMDSNNTLVSSLLAAKKGGDPTMYCLPKDGIEVGQAVRITVKWLHEHPDKLHLEGDILVYMSLTDAFPCK
jgi:Ssp1 endopeptidase immunity protein Rap1a